MPEKLPLPKEWYRNWDLDRMSSQASAAGNAETMDTEGSKAPQTLKMSGHSRGVHEHFATLQHPAKRCIC